VEDWRPEEFVPVDTVREIINRVSSPTINIW